MRQLRFLIILGLLTGCKTVLHETQVAENVLHDLEMFEVKVENDLEEPAGCSEVQ